MHAFAVLLSFVLANAIYTLPMVSCHELLKSAQLKEDAEDERLWQYLLDPVSF
jgi:hypothetical protein